MPFGLRNAPTHFQRSMDVVLSDLIDYSSVYIDDVVIFPRTWDEHLLHIDCVLNALCSRGFTVKPGKCVWAARSVEYLGYQVGEGLLARARARARAWGLGSSSQLYSDYFSTEDSQAVALVLGNCGILQAVCATVLHPLGGAHNIYQEGHANCHKLVTYYVLIIPCTQVIVV